MPDEQSTSHGAIAGDTAIPAQEPGPATEPAYAPPAEADDYAPIAEEEDDDWPEEPEQLPPRPRRRLLGAGINPIPLALIGVLLIAGGFIAGVLVEKGQVSGGSSSATGLASRFAALRGAGASTTTGSGASAGGTGGSFAGRSGGLGGAGASGATIGEVSFIAGNTLYVTSAEGNTVKVTTSPASSITKTVKSDVHGIHPGETVVVRGAKSSAGAVSAESVSVSAAGAAGGGIASLFGGGSGGVSGSASGSSGSSRTGGGTPSLFGG